MIEQRHASQTCKCALRLQELLREQIIIMMKCVLVPPRKATKTCMYYKGPTHTDVPAITYLLLQSNLNQNSLAAIINVEVNIAFHIVIKWD